MSSIRKPRKRLWRWRRNPLRRRGDRVEAWAGLTAATAALVAAPLTGTLAGSALTASVSEHSGWHHTTAVLTAEAQPLGGDTAQTGSPRVSTPVKWRTPGGTSRTAEAPVRAGTQPHTRVTVWLDEQGVPQPPPPSARAAAAEGAVVGGLAASGSLLLIAAAYGFIRHRIATRNAREWEREWAEVGPRWSQHA